MTRRIFQSLRAIAKQLSIVMLSLLAVLCIYPTAAFAALENTPIETPGLSQSAPDENLAEMQQQRREWQSQVSASRKDEANSPGETVIEKLNLDEILPGSDRDTKSFKPDRSAQND
ncbi:MAG: hypothetical protein KME16_10675 [Scytolyngbya sp. HA4215-MV1]|jgi:hypothetical protein|nr:hypothetical protein [Scytolyngbya sp. HA4215-MV1]